MQNRGGHKLWRKKFYINSKIFISMLPSWLPTWFQSSHKLLVGLQWALRPAVFFCKGLKL